MTGEPPERTRPRLGLCSVTFRRSSAAEVAAATAAAGLEAIEWGSDVHAPPDDTDAIARVREVTEQHGLVTCSYGTYFEAGVSPRRDLLALSDAANRLGASRLRLWAGTQSSARTSPERRRQVTSALIEAADVASDHGQTVALEYHGGSLTDTPESTLRLLEEIDRPNVTTYWQAPIGKDDDLAVAELEAVASKLSAVHAFSWWPAEQRRPLAYRHTLWERVCDVLSRSASPVEDMLLEFVPDDDIGSLPTEAATLMRLGDRW